MSRLYWKRIGKPKKMLSCRTTLFIAFSARCPLRIRTLYLTIGCSISARCTRKVSHLRCTQLGNQVSMVKKQRLLPSMVRFLLPYFQVFFRQRLYHPPSTRGNLFYKAHPPSKTCRTITTYEKRIQILKSASHDPVLLALATKVAPKLLMSLPPTRWKMKATRPLSKPEHALCVEYVPSSTLHSEAHSSTKEQLPDSNDVSTSIEEFAFRVVNHDYVFQASPTTIKREDVEIQTWSNTTHLFHQAIKVPPPMIEGNGLYVSLSPRRVIIGCQRNLLMIQRLVFNNFTNSWRTARLDIE